MKQLLMLLTKLYRDEEGQDLAEYGLLISLIAIAVIGGVTIFGGQMQTFFSTLAGKLGLPGA